MKYQHIKSVILIIVLNMYSQQSLGERWTYEVSDSSSANGVNSTANITANNYFHDLDFSLSFNCKDDSMYLWVSPGTHITSKSTFKLMYRVDDNSRSSISLKTVEKKYGYAGTTNRYAEILSGKKSITTFAKELLGGKSILVYIDSTLTTNISLSGSDKAITKVFSDCGEDITKK